MQSAFPPRLCEPSVTFSLRRTMPWYGGHVAEHLCFSFVPLEALIGLVQHVACTLEGACPCQNPSLIGGKKEDDLFFFLHMIFSE